MPVCEHNEGSFLSQYVARPCDRVDASLADMACYTDDKLYTFNENSTICHMI